MSSTSFARSDAYGSAGAAPWEDLAARGRAAAVGPVDVALVDAKPAAATVLGRGGAAPAAGGCAAGAAVGSAVIGSGVVGSGVVGSIVVGGGVGAGGGGVADATAGVGAIAVSAMGVGGGPAIGVDDEPPADSDA